MSTPRILTITATVVVAGGLLRAAGGDDTETLDSATEDPFADVNRRAREYGFTVCGEEG
jgi:hypothetical protein